MSAPAFSAQAVRRSRAHPAVRQAAVRHHVSPWPRSPSSEFHDDAGPRRRRRLREVAQVWRRRRRRHRATRGIWKALQLTQKVDQSCLVTAEGGTAEERRAKRGPHHILPGATITSQQAGVDFPSRPASQRSFANLKFLRRAPPPGFSGRRPGCSHTVLALGRRPFHIQRWLDRLSGSGT